MQIREAIASDAQQMIALFIKLENETNFMMMEPGEKQISVDQQRARINEFATSNDKLMAIAVVDNQISGFIVALAGNANRNRHAAYMVIGVQQSCWGQGVGSALIEYMENWVKASSLHRVEFTVMENNIAARSLYRKHGYAEEGVKLDSLKVNGIYVNELYMGKLF